MNRGKTDMPYELTISSLSGTTDESGALLSVKAEGSAVDCPDCESIVSIVTLPGDAVRRYHLTVNPLVGQVPLQGKTNGERNC